MAGIHLDNSCARAPQQQPGNRAGENLASRNEMGWPRRDSNEKGTAASEFNLK